MTLRSRTLGLTAASALAAIAFAGCAQTPPTPQQPPHSSTSSRPTASPTFQPTRSPSPASPRTSASPTTSPTTPVATCPKAASGFVERAPGAGKTVALTFDDGPGPADASIVEILDRYGIHATFFETGQHAAARPDLVRLLAQHGELLGDHTWGHWYPRQVPGGWTVSYLLRQFDRTDDEISLLSGAPVCFFRPPGGFQNNVLAAASRRRLTSVLWSTDSLDWQQPNHTTSAATAAIVKRATAVNGNAHPIVLMHSFKASHEPESRVSSYRGNTIAALPAVIEWYHAHGYRFVRMDGKS